MKKKKKQTKRKFLKLDLGCGQRKRKGFIGVDIAKIPGVDVVFDLTKSPWPFDSGSVDEMYCAHFFEHLTGPERMLFMNELYRVMIPNGKGTIIVPHYMSERATQDPTHQWPPLSKASFVYFNKEWRVHNKLDHYPITCDFDYSYGNVLPQEWASKNPVEQAFAVEHYMNVSYDLQIYLIRR